MKERPIFFSAPMVRAILDGRKTMTRRVATRKYTDPCSRGLDKFFATMHCKVGIVGDHLWVRENYRFSSAHDNIKPCQVPVGDDVEYFADTTANHYLDGKCRPSIFMPRWASRITLEIAGVWVERLNDISEEDAMAEGCQWTDNGPRKWASKGDGTFKRLNPVNGWKEGFSHTGETEIGKCYQSAKVSFGTLWESINGAGSWDKNPFVWVISFKRI